ncbi:hypothetical protein M3I54_35950 [Paraburkholderia sp. CNPSo 3274]|uniref:hypothetical protein n=1 Tax=unclassified Paraburkholderia TaxID=2615204 RepID=UPI0020B83E13|nr:MULTISPECIES: hypothetical protein [unclassified Paraburkholderia]MCP3712277.1 hypothetical protein [Paraburkholderia sp. CNPSo 3274]MCP3718496.1 hypothetical protein [Paraburkholderia sp. CNPSo 3281]MCP3724663.1 hypothetical protein [Paraburkholderia sp. CNPSo 3272]
MSDKIEMTVTVNPLVSPKLYQRLRACSSPRERAIVFRALAEARLWDETMGNAHPVERGAPDRREATAVPVYIRQATPVPLDVAPSQNAATGTSAVVSRGPIAPSTTRAEMGASSDAFQTVRVADSDDSGSAFGDALSNEFAQFD